MSPGYFNNGDKRVSSFTIHIVSSNYTGPAGSFDFEKNFFRKYDDVKKGLTPKQLLKVGRFIQDDIKSFVRKWGWKNIERAILLNEISPGEVAIMIEESQQKKSKWLNFGTEGHWIPESKMMSPGRALSWTDKSSGERFFSKGHWVSGIIAYDFFKLSAEARSKVQNYINKIKIFSKN